MNPIHRNNLQTLIEQGISLSISYKKVKNINFRIKVAELKMSAPPFASEYDIANAIDQRIDWIINTHQKLLSKQQSQPNKHANPNQGIPQDTPLILWGDTYEDRQLNETQRLKVYRQQLIEVMPKLFSKWQPIVGKTAKEQRIKKMKTRWGSCNTRASRVWLSIYLPAYPIECTEYVIVHELCHLHHANHSPQFWAEVAKAMPDYQHWHDLLAGKNQQVN